MGFTSNSEKALRFLVVFGEVSDILRVNGYHAKNPSYLFEVDENLDSVDKMDNIFIKIVISLQMNKEDPGLATLKYMSTRAIEGDPLSEIMNKFSEKELRQVLGLCTDVIEGIRYILRNDNKGGSTYSDPINVSRSFIQHLKTEIGS